MKIGFTGHRDRLVNEEELDQIRQRFPGAVWVHGGAIGFDRQVAAYARSYRIPQIVIRPDYQNHPPKQAPLMRNRQIVDQVDVLAACYDGRQGGGTTYTIRYAEQQGKPVMRLTRLKEIR